MDKQPLEKDEFDLFLEPREERDFDDLEEFTVPQELSAEQHFTHTVEAAGGRVDGYLTQLLPKYSRSFMQKLIREGRLLVNGKQAKANLVLKEGDTLALTIPAVENLAVVAENIPLDIAYEDSDIIVVNKPRGMVVHPAAGNFSGTLVNALLYHCHDLSGIGGTARPGIVHRLDKETSGLLVVAKNDEAHRGLQNEWTTKEMNRYYTALVHGNLTEPTGIIDAPIGRHQRDRKKMAVTPGKGRRAVTNYRVLERFGRYTLIEAKLETGRTHQIRVHMAYIGHPVVGDEIYGPRKQEASVSGQYLHSTKMFFRQPVTNEQLECTAPLPQDFEDFLADLRQG